jgi:hypothetical protein
MRGSKLFVALALTLATGVQPVAQSAGGRGASPAARPEPVAPNRSQVPALPSVPASAVATIHVSAVSPTNTALPGWLVRLRDARYGRLVAAHTTDESGTFTFRDVDPGSYIIELVGGDQFIQATSALLSVDAGAIVYAVVRLPSRPEGLSGFFSHGMAQAAAIAAAAAAAGVLAVQSTTDVSPR